MTTGTALSEPRQEESGRILGAILRSLSGPRRDQKPSQQYEPLWTSTPDNLVFQRSNSQESGCFVPYEQRFPRTNLVDVGADQVGGGGLKTLCIKIGYGSREPRRVFLPCNKLEFVSAMY